MAALQWDQPGTRKFELGSKKGVLYVQNKNGTYKTGVAWNGLSSVTESREGGEQNDQYADNIQYVSITTEEKFGGTIEAFTYPDDFKECDGQIEIVPGLVVSSQNRSSFGFCYRTEIGNDTNGIDHGYKLHIVYSAKAKPTEKAYETENDSPEAITFSWEFSTTKNYYEINGVKKYLSHIEINSNKVNKDNLADLEAVLYGSEEDDPRLPTPNEVFLYLIGASKLPTPTIMLDETILSITEESGNATSYVIYDGNNPVTEVPV